MGSMANFTSCQDKCCENSDDHRPFTSITFPLMMTKDIDDDNYEIEEDESEEEECDSSTLLLYPSLCNLKTKI